MSSTKRAPWLVALENLFQQVGFQYAVRQGFNLRAFEAGDVLHTSGRAKQAHLVFRQVGELGNGGVVHVCFRD